MTVSGRIEDDRVVLIPPPDFAFAELEGVFNDPTDGGIVESGSVSR